MIILMSADAFFLSFSKTFFYFIASKCRQKKKQWMKGLESNYEKLSTQNQRLRSMVMLFQEEVNALKTELLTRNGVCSCTDMRTYYHNNNTVSTMDPRNSFTHANYVPTSQSMTMSMPTTTTLPSVSPPEPNDFLPNNTLPPLSLSLPPYLNE
ncbi:hypothetical protein BC941DRAFT_252425 [Chlamydoabsidia padenii]|nr:hypothetical protein BC941DRAFT_252425 [Chlamydoabsidia padenii]